MLREHCQCLVDEPPISQKPHTGQQLGSEEHVTRPFSYFYLQYPDHCSQEEAVTSESQCQ
jgi:hypothetical protein